MAVPVLGTAIVLGAAWERPFAGYWLPDSIGPRTESIDGLMNLIHLILGVVFMLTGLVLAFSLFRYSSDRPGRASSRRGNLLLELLWTLIPAGVLGWLVFYQAAMWDENKLTVPLSAFPDTDGNYDKAPPVARVVARQFDWTFVYPGTDGEFDTRDDIISSGLLVLPTDRDIVLELASEDVIHSFCINALRLKQDIVPGLNSLVWFKVLETGEWEINCMELCGWGHYRMSATMQCVSKADFESWKATQYQNQQR